MMDAMRERLGALRARFGLLGDEYAADPQLVALDAAAWATDGSCSDIEQCVVEAVQSLSPDATPVERAMALVFTRCLAAEKRDATAPVTRAECPPLAYTVTPDGVVYLLAHGKSISHCGEVIIRPKQQRESIHGVEVSGTRHVLVFSAHLSQVPMLSLETLRALPMPPKGD